MRIARIRMGERTAYAVLEGDNACLLAKPPFEGIERTGETVPLAQCTLLAPCEPSKAVCVGLNYADHAREMQKDVPIEPLFFLKPPSAVLDPLGIIDYPPQTSDLQFEAELAVVIGKRAHRISVDQVSEHVLGYTCSNDVSARDLQKLDVQYSRAKAFDTFLPLGPWIETELNPETADIRLTLNGELKQNSNTRCLITPVAQIVALASQIMTLLPGDVILTGTPSGARSMQVGDTVSIEIGGIGTLTNTIGIVR